MISLNLNDLKNIKVETPAEAKAIESRVRRLIKETKDRKAGIHLLDKALIEMEKYQIEKGGK